MAGNNFYVQGSYIDIHDNEVVNLSVDKGVVHLGDHQQSPKESTIPKVLADSELWYKVQQAGLVDADGQPTVTRPEAALLAYLLAKRLEIVNKWKLFEQLWHRNNMRGDYNTALGQRKSLEFQERLKNILG
jgi:DNA-binding response OmpR family regulator